MEESIPDEAERQTPIQGALLEGIGEGLSDRHVPLEDLVNVHDLPPVDHLERIGQGCRQEDTCTDHTWHLCPLGPRDLCLIFAHSGGVVLHGQFIDEQEAEEIDEPRYVKSKETRVKAH